MKKAALQICLAIGLVILTANVSAQDSLKTNMQQAVSCNDRGVAAIDVGKFDDAIQLFKEAIRLRPDYAVAYGNLGAALYHKGQFEEAITILKKAIQLNSDYAEYYNKLDVRARAATFLKRFFLNLCLRVFGFAPR